MAKKPIDQRKTRTIVRTRLEMEIEKLRRENSVLLIQIQSLNEQLQAVKIQLTETENTNKEAMKHFQERIQKVLEEEGFNDDDE